MSEAIRPARPGDYAAYCELFKQLLLDDPIPSEDRFVDELAPRILIADAGDHALGYVLFDRFAGDGYIRNIAVAPAARGARLGERLMRAAAAELRARGATADWHLNVKVDNAPAIKLYERLGFAVEHASVALLVPWDARHQLPVDPEPVDALPVAPEEDDEVERGVGVLSGWLERARMREGTIIRVLRDRTLAAVGLASFDPSFPGAYPFRVARPALARPLLDALLPHARPGDAELQLVIEDDAALVDTLLAAGAKIRLELLHYKGALPA